MALRSLFNVALVTLTAQRAAATCVSFGVDFQDGNTYFQNSLSTDPFTFVSQFEGCQNDTAFNILVDPNGDQYLCSDTNLQPDDTNQLSTCPEDKNQLFSGDWSVVIISNNGDGTGIAYQRDFSLNVGPQQTTTSTPTVTISTTTVPLTSTTVTTTVTTTITAATASTTPAAVALRAVEATPSQVTTTTTATLYTTTKVNAEVSILKTTKYVTASCKLPVVATTTDKTCSIQITVAGVTAPKATQTAKMKFRFARNAPDTPPLDKEHFLKERRQYIEARLDKRAPDVETVTITDTNTSNYPTSTVTVTQSAVTVTFVDTVTTTATSTPATLANAQNKVAALTVSSTTATPIQTIRMQTVVSTTISTTYSSTVTITMKTTPASLKSACETAGGVLF